MTLKQHLSTVKESCLRCMEVEDTLVARTWDDPIRGLPEAVAMAAEALRQMDLAYDALPDGACPWVWPISLDERELVAKLLQKHPADATTLRRVADLVGELSEDARVDEVAEGTIRALKCVAMRSKQTAQS
jgi:hypothetical protein